MKTRLKTSLLWSCTTLALMTPWASAADPAPEKESETVFVPYDPKKPVAQQKPDRFYVPYERFLELWSFTKENRTVAKREAAPQRFVLSAARYEGVFGEHSVTFTGKLDVTTDQDSWVEVPLPFKDVKVSSLKIDGAAAAYDQSRIIVEKPGRHQVEVTFEIPLSPGAQTLQWGVPRTGATLVTVLLPDERTRATIAPGGGVIEETENGRKRVTAALGATERVQLSWKSEAATARIAEPAVAAIRTQLMTKVGREETVTEFALQFPGARQDRFTVYLEKGLTLTRLGATNIKSWRLIEEGNRQALEITLNEPATESYQFQISAERPLPNLPADLKAPVISAAAKRVEYTGLAFCIGDRVDVTPRPEPSQRQIPWEHPIGNVERVVAAYAGAGQSGYRVSIREPQREARVDYVYQVNRRKTELIASLQLFAKGDDISVVTLSLPAQFEVQAIESERLQDWWREGDRLHVRFRGATPEKTALMVYLVRQYPAAPTELDVRPLVLEGFKKTEGEAVVAAHKGVDASMKLSTDARELAPDLAATAFQILPPLERKRGFGFKNQTFAAQVALAALPAKIGALWVLHAQAHEGWIAVSLHARLSMRQGSIDRASFTLPAAVPEARVTGADVLEVRSRVEGDRRIYDVQFQNDVYEAVEFTADLEMPNPGNAALPAVTFPEAQMTNGYVLTDNASEFEMKLKTSGADPAPTSEIPFLPVLSKSAGIYRVQPDWSVSVGIERLEKAAARAAFVSWAEMTTALRDDGTEWHRATYRLQNRSLQFLPVKMPAGAELMSVRVAGQNVRADAGKVRGTEAILVPLIKTKPGDLSYDVELVYRREVGPLRWWAHRELDDPELLGITVERTFWNVWLPEDRKLQRTSGNMEPVLAEVNKAEKLEGTLQELKSLVTLANSSSASSEVKEAASMNFFRLKKTIETENRDENFQESASYVRKGKDASPTPAEETVGKKGIAQQGGYVANKRREINDALGREVQKFDDANRQPQQRQMEVQSGVRSGNQPVTANAIDALLFGANAQPPMQNDLAVQSNGVANLNGTTQSVGNITLNGNVQSNSERWTANNAFIVQGKANPAPAVNNTGNGKNVYFNDNVVLQQTVETAEAKKPVSGKNKAAVSAKREDEMEEVVETIPPQKQAAQKAVEASANPNQGLALNTARGNVAWAAEQQLAVRNGVSQPPLAPPPPLPPQQQLQEPMPSAPGQPAITVPGAAFTAGGTVGVAAPAFDNGPVAAAAAPAGDRPSLSSMAGDGTADQAQRMQAAGRISLAVDFPTEGQAFHFKKVKANAQLGLTVVAPESFTRWQYVGMALMGAALLAWVSRWAERRNGGGRPLTQAGTGAI